MREMISVRTTTLTSAMRQEKSEQSNPPHPLHSANQTAHTSLSCRTDKSLLKNYWPIVSWFASRRNHVNESAPAAEWQTGMVCYFFYLFFVTVMMLMRIHMSASECLRVQQMHLHALPVMKVPHCQFVCPCDHVTTNYPELSRHVNITLIRSSTIIARPIYVCVRVCVCVRTCNTFIYCQNHIKEPDIYDGGQRPDLTLNKRDDLPDNMCTEHRTACT